MIKLSLSDLQNICLLIAVARLFGGNKVCVNMKLLLWLLVGVFILGVKSEDDSGSESKVLRLVQIVYRHGDRAPIFLYPNDPNINHKWPEGLGELTNLGKSQHYALGRFLKKLYKGFLTNNPEEIYVRSSGVSRCLESAECNLASMYPPRGKWVWNDDLNWQPIPVETVPLPEDNLLNPNAYCPEADKEETRIRNSPAAKEYIKKHQALFEYLTEKSGMKVTFWAEVHVLFDTLETEKKYNLKIPLWAELVWNQMDKVTAKAFYWYYSTKLIQKLRAGPLLGQIIKNMMQETKEDSTNGTKLFMYSTHDVMIAAILNALGVFNNKAPPYCATIIFELYSDGFQDHTVKILYLNSSNPEKEPQILHVLKLNGCSSDCQLERFVELTSDVIPDNWKKECGLEDAPEIFSEQNFFVTAVLGPLFITSLIAIMILLLWRTYCQKRKLPFPPAALTTKFETKDTKQLLDFTRNL